MAFSPVAKFVHGSPTMIDYTPAAAVAAGDINIVGAGSNSHFIIAHTDLAAGVLGAASVGDAVYDIVKNASDNFLDRQAVAVPFPFYNTASKADSALLLGGTNSSVILGYAIGVPGSVNTYVRVFTINKVSEITP